MMQQCREDSWYHPSRSEGGRVWVNPCEEFGDMADIYFVEDHADVGTITHILKITVSHENLKDLIKTATKLLEA